MIQAKLLDARSRGPEKPLQGRIRRAAVSRLRRARVSRWSASGNYRFYDWRASSGSVVGNDPINAIDPTGMQACDGENDCIEASNFKEEKADGQTVTQSGNIDDVARRELPGIETQRSPDERVVAFSESDDGSVQTTEATPISQGEKGGTIETKAQIPAGTDSVGHSHPNRDSSVAPGKFDDRVVNSGMPNNIVNNGTVIVIEKVNGQFRARVLSGRPNGSERRQTRSQLRKFQRRTQ